MMRIEFPQGDEPRWNAQMIGSRKAALTFKRCVVAVIEANPKTQPYGGGAAKPTQPVKPVAKDDGSI
jgi:hypothetical protein